MSRGGENREHHKGRVSIRRAHPEFPFDPDNAVEVAFKRGGLTVHDLYEFGAWWADRWAMSEPGTVFYAVPNWTDQQEYRTVMPADYPPVPLPDSSEEFDVRERNRLAAWDAPQHAEAA